MRRVLMSSYPVGSWAERTQPAKEGENVDLPYFICTCVHGKSFRKHFFKKQLYFKCRGTCHLQKTYLTSFIKGMTVP